MALSLYNIEDSLALLAETREAAEAEGDAAAVAECDKALAQYLTAEAAKVNSYAALIRRQLAEAEECEAEAQRIAGRARTRRAFVDRLKATALEVMQRFGVKELRSATNTLRVQKNGGVQSLGVEWPKDASGNYTPLAPDDPFRPKDLPVKVFMLPDTAAIRAAISHGSTVPGARLLERGSHLRVE